jgi:hypothetical protein
VDYIGKKGENEDTADRKSRRIDKKQDKRTIIEDDPLISFKNTYNA